MQKSLESEDPDRMVRSCTEENPFMGTDPTGVNFREGWQMSASLA